MQKNVMMILVKKVKKEADTNFLSLSRLRNMTDDS